jgi:hypothetical protein
MSNDRQGQKPQARVILGCPNHDLMINPLADNLKITLFVPWVSEVPLKKTPSQFQLKYMHRGYPESL